MELEAPINSQCRIGIVGADRGPGFLWYRRQDGDVRRAGGGVCQRAVAHVPRLVRIAPTKLLVIGPCGNIRNYPVQTRT